MTKKNTSQCSPTVIYKTKKYDPTISLCMIARDEAKNLPECLDSVKSIVDEIILVDTGSKDDTKKIALDYGAIVSDFKWIDDFSAARNFGIRQATKDWILIMDADDRLAKSSKNTLKKIVSKNADKKAFSVWIEGANDGFRSNSLRLFKNFLNIHYVGRIHETVDPGDVKGGFGLDSHIAIDIVLKHTGNEMEADHEKKSRRNIRILNKAVKHNPQDSYLNYYLGAEYMSRGETSRAIEYYLKALTPYLELKPGSSVLRKQMLLPNILFALIDAYTASADLKKALEISTLGINFYPKDGELYYMAGTVEQYQRNYSEAIVLFEKAVKNPTQPFITSSGTSELKSMSLRGIATSYFYLDEMEKAKKYYIKALKINNQDIQSIRGLAYSLRNELKPHAALRIIDKHANIKDREIYADILSILTGLKLQF